MRDWLINLLGGVTELQSECRMELLHDYYEEELHNCRNTIKQLQELLPKRRPRKK